MAIGKKRLGDLLVATGYITQEALQEVLKEQNRTGERLGRILVNKGYITEQNLIEALEFQLGIPHVVLAKEIPQEVVAAVPEHIANKYKVFPVEKEGNRLVLGMVDPTDVVALDNLRLLLNVEIQPVIVTEEDLQRALGKYYGIKGLWRRSLKTWISSLKRKRKKKNRQSKNWWRTRPLSAW